MEFPDKFKEMMENESDDDELENVSEAFICCICRELLYKPVVLACGHISCFWCVHKSMSSLHNSRCPICRNRYYHFPFICQILHMLLLKLYPNAYKRRENQILEEEKEMGNFSPQFHSPAQQLQPEETITLHSKSSLPLDPCSIRVGGAPEKMEQGESGSVNQNVSLSNMQTLNEDNGATVTNASNAKDRHSSQMYYNQNSEHIAVDDVLCPTCKRLLFRPIVLNCGHSFCESCFVVRTNEMLKCEVCQSPHPGNFPKVCLEFDQFLGQQFPKEYDLRRSMFHRKQEQSSSETPITCSTVAGNEGFHFSISPGEDPLPWWNSSSKVHIGVGCDSCGLYPIVGDRYRCKDCVEQVGYDLCKDCYTTRSKLPGRFNQQHTSDHMFEIVKSNPMHSIMVRLLRGQLREVSAVSDALQDSSTNLIPSLSDDTSENLADAPFPSNDSDPNQNDNQPSAER